MLPATLVAFPWVDEMCRRTESCVRVAVAVAERFGEGRPLVPLCGTARRKSETDVAGKCGVSRGERKQCSENGLKRRLTGKVKNLVAVSMRDEPEARVPCPLCCCEICAISIRSFGRAAGNSRPAAASGPPSPSLRRAPSAEEQNGIRRRVRITIVNGCLFLHELD